MEKSLRRFRWTKIVLGFFVLLCSFVISSCAENPDKELRLYIDDCFYWATGNYEDTVEDASKYEYKKLERMGYKNIRELVGKDGKYVWLKAEFTIPEALKNDDLSMLIPYMHFAEELYLNGKYIDDYGTMGENAASPDIQEAGFNAHLFDFPEGYLNQEGTNTILIKLFALGNATITDDVFIGTRRDGWKTYDNQNFWRSRIYVFFEGGMFICAMFFIMLYIAFRREKTYLHFAVLNIFSIIFFSNFFTNDLPCIGFHGGISYVWYFKLARCICFFMMIAQFYMFTLEYLGLKRHFMDKVICFTTLAVSSVLVLVAPDFYTLSNWCTIPLLPITAYNFIGPIFAIVISFRDKERKQKARFMAFALTPLLITILTDFVIKAFVKDIELLYFSLLGWIMFILIFFVYFSLSYNGISKRLEYLNQGLEKEVKNKTQSLLTANERLEDEKEITQKDMKMAALVQKKFFHAPQNELDNWEFAVYYEPLSIVSGDFYNFYHKGTKLEGLTLFDTSGHGVAASLVTMLAENIIQQTYEEYSVSRENVAEGLRIINNRFIAAKGDIENYLTGLLVSFIDNDDGTCSVALANAGHPNPLLYTKEEDEVEELLPSPDMPYTGPVGLKDFDIEYSGQKFLMKAGDILLLYTDGLTDSVRDNYDFDISKVMEILKKNSGESAQTIMQRLVMKLDEFYAKALRSDDVSVIILKRV